MKRLVTATIMNPDEQNSIINSAQTFLNNFIGGLLDPAGGPKVPITAGGGVPGELPVEKYQRDAILRHLENDVYPELRREVVPETAEGPFGPINPEELDIIMTPEQRGPTPEDYERWESDARTWEGQLFDNDRWDNRQRIDPNWDYERGDWKYRTQPGGMYKPGLQLL